MKRGVKQYPVPGGGVRLTAYAADGSTVLEWVIDRAVYAEWMVAELDRILDRLDPPMPLSLDESE